MDNTFLNVYKEFVLGKLSGPSTDPALLIQRIEELQKQGVQVAPLLASSMGMGGEPGEYVDLVKKILFHGKELTPELKDKMRAELGDVLFYVAAGCIGLGISLDEVIQSNMDKLNKRYPNGFTVAESENRKV